MLDKIIDFSIRNKLIVALLIVGLIGWGLYSLKHLPIDAVPDITNNQVQVITLNPALGAEEVERLITFPVEQAMATIPKIESVRSISRFGLSVVTVVFEDQVDIYWARQQVHEKISDARNEIPAEIGHPEISPISTGLGEIYQYVIHADKKAEEKYDAIALRSIQDWVVRRQLLGTPGVAEVNSFGGRLKQYEIAVDPDLLNNFDLDIRDVLQAIRKNNQNSGGAYLDKKPNAYFIRTEGLIEDFSDLEKLPVKHTAEGIPVLIKDVGSVKIGSAVRYGALTRNGENEAVGGIVMMLKGANAKDVVDLIKQKVDRINKTLPEGVVVEAFLDRSVLVDRAMDTVTSNLLEGALIVIFVLVLFLGDVRAGLVVASVIPLSMLFAIGMMNVFGVSGNLMSLGAIDFGLIVDGAVIIVEATLHTLGMKSRHLPYSQVEMDREVARSSKKMMGPAAFGQVIILIVYLPILALVGIEGKMFRPMAETVSFAILGAFLLSISYVPMISSLLLSKGVSRKRSWSQRIMESIQRAYKPMLKGALQRRKIVLVVTGVFMMFSIYLFRHLGAEFIPTLEEGDFAVETRLLTGSSLSQSIEKVNQASRLLISKFPEVKEVIGKIGAAEIPTDPMPMEACDLTILLKDKKEWTSADSREELADKMAAALENIAGVSFGFSQPIQLRSNELISGVRQDIGIKVFGDDLNQLTEISRRIGKIVNSVEGAKDLYLEQVDGLPQVVVEIKRDQIARYGLDVETVNQTINAAFAGQSAGILYEGERRYEIVVRLPKSRRNSLEDVRNIYIAGKDGVQVPLSQLATVELRVGTNQIQREDSHRRILIGLNVRGRDISSVVTEIRDKIDQQIKLPAGYYLSYGGQFENLEAAVSRLSIVVPAALVLILSLLYLSFKSWRQSLLIFSAIPMAASGGVVALYLRGMPFSISAGIGFIALFGVAVLNGIVLITEFNRLKSQSDNLHDLVTEGSLLRLRPVLMTAMVASMGFLPMALSTAAGAEVQKPLATVVIGGLISATLLTLLVIPVLFTFIEKPFVKKWKAQIFLFVILGGLVPLKSFGQKKTNTQLRSVEQAVAIAIENHPSLKSGRLAVEEQSALRGAVFDLGKTKFELEYGQLNGPRNDNSLSIGQDIPFSVLTGSSAKVQEAEVLNRKLKLKVSRNQLVYRVKTAFLQLTYDLSQKALYEQQDTIFRNFLRASSLRYEAGETNLLEKTTAEARRDQVSLQSKAKHSDIEISKAVLCELLNLPVDEVDVDDDLIMKRELSPLKTSEEFVNNPELTLQKQNIALSEAQVKLERSRSGPDFSIGYFSQSFIGTPSDQRGLPDFGPWDRFQGIQLGVSVPAFFKPFSSRIRAAKIRTQIEKSEYDQLTNELRTMYRKSSLQQQQQADRLAYYETSGVPNAERLLTQSKAAFKAGEIGYMEYLQSLQTYAEIRLDFLQSVYQYNKSIYESEYILGLN